MNNDNRFSMSDDLIRKRTRPFEMTAGAFLTLFLASSIISVLLGILLE